MNDLVIRFDSIFSFLFLCDTNKITITLTGWEKIYGAFKKALHEYVC